MVQLKIYPEEYVHRKTADGAYVNCGKFNGKIRKDEAQVIVVGPMLATADQYAEAAAFLVDWPGFKIRSVEPMPAVVPSSEEEVRRRGFVSIILDRAEA